MLKFADCYPPGPNKSLCEGWCCGYTPAPRDPRKPAKVLSAEEQERIEQLKQKKVYSKSYFETLEDIYTALDFELENCIANHKVREAEGQFFFRGNTYSYARIFDFEHDEAWVEIKDAQGKILYGKDIEPPCAQSDCGEEPRTCHAAELVVELQLNTPCRRTLIVPSELNLYQLHKVLQGSFEWFDRHLHQFVLERDAHGEPKKIAALPLDEGLACWISPCLDSRDVTVKEIFSAYRKIDYEYDFSDGWVHTITLNRFIDCCTTVCPHCTDAVGDAPMEDCGGPDGFEQITAILKKTDHPDHAEVLRQVHCTWSPLDLDAINRRLGDVYSRLTSGCGES